MPNENDEQREKLLQLVKDAVKRDQDLRDKYEIGEKFRFIRDRLHALLLRLEENLKGLEKQAEKKKDELSEDETLAYVYLYNAQGMIFPSWQKMVNPSVFYEYSVNRPIYTDRANVDAFIRSKPNRAQHGYLTVAIKKADILPTPAGLEATKDSLNHPLIKVREGSLNFDKLISFTHNGQDYVISNGELVKKNS